MHKLEYPHTKTKYISTEDGDTEFWYDPVDSENSSTGQLQFLAQPATSSCYRKDFPISETNSSQTASSSTKIEWEEEERKTRVLEKIKNCLSELNNKVSE